MRVSFAGSSVELRSWESKDDLRHHLNQCAGGSLLIGESREQERSFYSAKLRTEFLSEKSNEFSIGVCSEGHGLVPHLLLLPESNLLLFGVNSEVVGIDTTKRRISFRIHFESLFRCLIHLKPQALILAFHEIGVNALGEDGKNLWNYSKDVLVGGDVKGNVLKLRFMDSDPVRLDLLSGRPMDG
ncbi:MAG: hypothetical protein L0387_11705 [Acidobacteria bacterium]|nr:hypothetical protein [Acidobacteriota bacterium]MCI0719048.1 hypothetical protein [Acidobacteriota bacterium]